MFQKRSLGKKSEQQWENLSYQKGDFFHLIQEEIYLSKYIYIFKITHIFVKKNITAKIYTMKISKNN